MKKFKLFFSSAFVMAVFAGSSNASVYIDNFESYGLGDITTGGNAAHGWVSSDPTAGVGYVQNLNGSWGSRSASIGFVSPLLNDNVFLSHTASTPLVGGGVDASFSARFQVIDSDAGYNDPLAVPPITGSENRDKFGFRLESSTGANLFTFYLNPTSQVPDPQSQTEYNSYSWSTGTGAATVALPGYGSQETFAYTLTVNFFNAGGGDVGFNADVNGSGFSGVIPGAASESIANFGAIWNTLNGKTAPGSNFMVFDNVSLVPEPSSALLGLLGVSFVFVRRRRA